jgi:hypothetical protein
MPPQMTHSHASAQDAFEHLFASAGALVFVNASSGAAAPPAPSHACAEHTLAYPLAPLYPILGEHTCRKKRLQNLRPSSVSTGPMPTMIFAYKRRAPRNASTAVSAPHQTPLRPGWVPCRSAARANRSPSASTPHRPHRLCLAQIPLPGALSHHPPDPRTVPRSVYPQPREG